MAPIAVRQTAATAATAVVWAMRNTDVTKSVRVRKVYVSCGFDGAAEATTQDYQVCKFDTATPTGGTAVVPVPKTTTMPASCVTDARVLDTGLTKGSMSVKNPMTDFGVQRQVGARGHFETKDEGPDREEIILAPGEGLCIVLALVSVIGDSIRGFVEWAEDIPV
jgi:hypothetical protein